MCYQDNNTTFYCSSSNKLINISLIQDIDDDDDEERMTNGDFSQDLTNDEDDLRDPVDVSQSKFKRSDKFKVSSFKERLTLAEKNERLQSQLRSLKEDLANTRDDQVRARQSADIS